MNDESVSPTQNPFVTTVTPAMDRAQRLISLRQHPGFLDLIRLSQQQVDAANREYLRYNGWDKDVMVALFLRAKAALEHHEMWLASVQSAIERGEAEARELREQNLLEVKSPQQIVEESDMLRIKMLEKFEEIENRIAGSY